MEEERKGEQKVGSTSPPLPPSPTSLKKRLCAGSCEKQKGLKSPNSSSCAPYPFRMRNPNLSNCHVCDSQNRGKDKLQTLDSQWRIVLLCKNCFQNVKSSKICSYCFDDISHITGGIITCCYCKRHIHQTCFYKHRGFNLWNDSDLLTCIDCWVPKAPNRVVGLSRKDNVSLSDDCSVKVSKEFSNSKALEDAVKDASSTAEIKKSAAVKAKEKAFRKAVVAKKAAEMAANALGLAVVAAREETQVKGGSGSNSLVDDAELAFRLHRAINSSRRIIKSLNSMNPKTMNCDGYALANKSNPKKPTVCEGLEVCNENIVHENTVKFVSEPSVHLGALEHGSSSIDLSLLEPRTKMNVMLNHIECKTKREDAVKITYKKRPKAGLAELCNSKDCAMELPVQEEQASCSDKVASSSATNCSVDSGSQSAFDEDSSVMEKKNFHRLKNVVRKYSRRFRGSNKCFKRYSRKKSTFKAMLDRGTDLLLE